MISTTILVISYGSLEKWICGNFNCQQNVSAERLKFYPCLGSMGFFKNVPKKNMYQFLNAKSV